MFRFSISALPWLPKIWRPTSALSFCIDCQKYEVSLPHFRSALTAKYVKFCSRTFALHWLAKIWSSAFRTCPARTSKDVKFRFCISSLPGLPKICSFAYALSLNLDCQRSEDRLLHLHSAFIAKYGKFRLRTSLLPWLQKICSFTLQICLHSQRCECTSALPWLPKFCLLSFAVGSYYVFPHYFVLSYMKRNEASLFASKN